MSDDQKQSQLYESVSALVDNQASPLELQRILALSEKSNGVRSRWHRYHLARAILRGEAKGLMTADISDSVRAAVANLELDFANPGTALAKGEAQPRLQTRARKATPRWFAPLGRLAVAASVALAVVLGAQQIPLQSTNSEMNLAVSELAATGSNYQRAEFPNDGSLSHLNIQNVSSASFVAPTNARMQSAYDFEIQRRQQLEEEEVRKAINRLMLMHAQQSSLDQSFGLMPFIRVSDSALMSGALQ